MSRRTVTCAHCGNPFVDNGKSEILDAKKRITCRWCYCEYCGGGHAVDEDAESCAASYEDGDGDADDFDPDVIYDSRRDALCGA